MNVDLDELDPDLPIPYTLTPLGKAECIISRLRARPERDYAETKLEYFERLCRAQFRPDEVEALFG
jgi:hypothetical protein